MDNPYLLDTPAVVSFSGGRTSGFMLWNILQAFGGSLPDGVKVVFANTGKERPETLDFVERCSQRWGVSVEWVEYRMSAPVTPPTQSAEWVGLSDDDKTAAWDEWHLAMEEHRTPTRAKPLSHGFARVGYETASRHGQPFEECIVAHKMLPNVVTRFCTQELKIRPMKKLARQVFGWDRWAVSIGIRADEPRRLAKARGAVRRERYEVVHPLGQAGATLADVTAFWKSHPFDLALQAHEGNCDLCFLKGRERTLAIMRDQPESADWWVRMEAAAVRRGLARNPSVALFRKDRPRYTKLMELSRLPGLFDDATDEDALSLSCHCTD